MPPNIVPNSRAGGVHPRTLTIPPLSRLLRGRAPAALWDDRAPIRAELFSVERLEEHASALIGRALAAGVAETAIHINAYHNPRRSGRLPLALKVEEVLDATGRVRRLKKWRSRKALESAFHVYRDASVHDFLEMAASSPHGRIAIPRSRWRARVTASDYPITIVL